MMPVLTGFDVKIDQVVNGSKVALVYRLVQRCNEPLPAFQDLTDVREDLLEISKNWSGSG